MARIILSVAIIASFFMPLFGVGLFGFGISITGWDLLYETLKNSDKLDQMPSGFVMIIGCLLVIFLSAVFVLIAALMKRRFSLALLPFMAAIAMVVYMIAQAKEHSEQMFEAMGVGFYVMIIGCLLLPFVGRRG